MSADNTVVCVCYYTIFIPMTPILQYWEMPPGRWLEDASDILNEQDLEEA